MKTEHDLYRDVSVKGSSRSADENGTGDRYHLCFWLLSVFTSVLWFLPSDFVPGWNISHGSEQMISDQVMSASMDFMTADCCFGYLQGGWGGGRDPKRQRYFLPVVLFLCSMIILRAKSSVHW